MSVQHYHDLCRRYRGRKVEIRTKNGRIHRGIISDVNDRHVFLRSTGDRSSLGGYGYGFHRTGSGYSRRGGYYNRGGFGFGIALGAIAGLVLYPFIF